MPKEKKRTSKTTATKSSRKVKDLGAKKNVKGGAVDTFRKPTR